jgi:hypothetical protein
VQLRRWYAEGDPDDDRARATGPFGAAPAADVRLVVHGRVRVRAARPGEPEAWHGFDVDFAYPPDFPFDKIEIRPDDPALRRRRHQIGHSGALCFMQEELEPWAVGYGIERAIEGAKDWFVGEVTGTFKNEVPAAELLSYLDLDARYVRAVLLPEHATWERAPVHARHGVFTLEWDRRRGTAGRGLAIFGVAGMVGERADDAAVRTANDRLWRAVRPGRFEDRVRGRKRARPAPRAGVPEPSRTHDVPKHLVADADASQLVQGLWFALDREPRPFHDLAGLEEALASHVGMPRAAFRQLVKTRALQRDARERGWLPVALNYPPARRRAEDVGPAREWLIVLLEWPSLPAHERKGRRAEEGFWPHVIVRGVPSFSVRPADLQRRVGPAYAGAAPGGASLARPLGGMRVVVAGVGALGSTVARSLAAMGVRTFVLIDPDCISPGNIVRHEARLPEVGLAKVDAMEKVLRETNPYIEVEVLDGTREQDGKVEALLLDPAKRPDLIIATVALKAVDGQLDDLARAADPPIPVLHAWVMAEAQVLRAFVYRAARTACLYCNGLYGQPDGGARAADGGAYIPEPNAPARPFYEASCTDPAFPGAGNANALAAHVIVEMALDALQDRLPDGESHWVFAGNRVRDLDPAFPVAPLTVARRGFPPHPECPVCNGAVLDLDLPAADRADYERELARARGEAAVPSAGA